MEYFKGGEWKGKKYRKRGKKKPLLRIGEMEYMVEEVKRRGRRSRREEKKKKGEHINEEVKKEEHES